MKKLISIVLILLLCTLALVACGGPSDEELLEQAKATLDAQMKNKAEATPADYEVLGVLSIKVDGENYSFTVDWSVTNRDGSAISEDIVKVTVGDTIIVDVNEEAEADTEYTLTATIKNADGKSVSTSYNRLVPKFKELTHKEFTEAEDDSAVVIKGIIAAVVDVDKEKDLYLMDADGGYFVYNIDKEHFASLNLVAGMEVRVRGIRGTYYGVNQVTDATIEILNATPVEVKPVDITEAMLAAPDAGDASVTKYQSMLVKLSGITILDNDKSNNTYYNILVGTHKIYLRISSSTNIMSAEDTTAFKNTFLDNYASGADAVGLVSIYGNQIYLIPVDKDAISNIQVIERTDAEALQFVKDYLLDSLNTINEPGKVELQNSVSYEGINFAWSIEENAVATLAGNVLTIPVLPDEDTTIKLTLTLTKGEAEPVTKEYAVKIAKNPTVVPDNNIVVIPGTAYKLVVRQKNLGKVLYFNGEDPKNGRYLLTAVNPDNGIDVYAELVEGTTDKYYLYVGSPSSRKYIDIDNNTETHYPLVSLNRYKDQVTNYFKYDAEKNVFTIDVTVVDNKETKTYTYYFGSRNQYDTYDLYKIDTLGTDGYFPAQLCSLVDTTKVSDADKVAREKNDLANLSFKGAGDYQLPINGGMFGKVVITWEVAENTTVTINDDMLLTYANPADANATVTITATLKCGEVTETKDVTVSIVRYDFPEADKLLTIPEAVEGANVLKHDTVSDNKYGVIGTVVSIANTTYGNFTIKDADGNTIYIYGAYSADGSKRFDAIEEANQPKVGDRVVVYGVLSNYNGPQMKKVWILIVGEGEYVVPTPPPPVEPTDDITYAEYVAAADGTAVTVKGIVTGIVNTTKKHELYLADNDGGYYVYDLTANDVANLAVGMEVRVTGKRETHYGTYQITNATVTVINETPAPKTPVNIDTVIAGATSMADANLIKYQSQLVTITGVVIKGINADDDSYYEFIVNGMTSYVRISTSANMMSDSDTETFKTTFNANIGKSATVTGIVAQYNGNFYIIPVTKDVYSNFSVEEAPITDADKVATEKEQLVLDTHHNVAGEITLAAEGKTYTDVTISWAVEENNGALAIVDGKLVVTPKSENTTVKVTATITLGEATDTKEFDVTVYGPLDTPEKIVNAAHALPKGDALDGTFTLTGVITSIETPYDTGYKNVTVIIQIGEMTDKLITCYRMKGTGADVIAVGDTITVSGTIKNYKGTIEFDAGCTLDSYTSGTPGGDDTTGGDTEPEVTTSTVATVIAGADGVYQVEGTVIAVNARGFLVKDSTGILFVYAGTGHTAALGDVVTVKGTSSVYGGAKQLGGTVTVNKTGTATVDHGTAAELTTTQIDAYATATTVTPLYVKITATLSKSSNYYNLAFAGATITGSIPYPANATELDALAGKTIEITGYVIYVTSSSSSGAKYLNILAMNVAEVTTGGDDTTGGDTEPEVTTSTIESILSAGAGTYTVDGTVIATNSRSFLLKDSTGIILVYTNDAPTVAVGDIATVEGAVSEYKETFQFAQPTVTKKGTATVEHGEPAVLDAAAFGEVVAPVAPAYVKVTGVLVKSGNYWNLNVEGATYPGSLTYLASELSATANTLNGKYVDVIGYTTGNTGTYVNLMVISITEAIVTDAAKVALEKANLDLATTTLANGGTADLASVGGAYTGVAITWTIVSDASNVATISNGVLTITPTTTAASVTIKAELALNSDTGSKEFTIEVASSEAIAANKTATLVSANLGLANNVEFTTTTIEDVTFTAAKNSGQNATKYYTSGSALRVYGSNSFTISVAEGYKIQSIVITLGSSNSIPEASVEMTNATATGLGTVTTTLTPTDGTADVVLTNSASSGHWKIVSIEVTYSAVE